MSSSKKPSRSPSRNTDPFSPQSNGFNSPQQSAFQDTNPMTGWSEPPPRQPVPSFQDNGLQRVGVVENMMALGTPPTARVRARAKGDPLRKVVQARHLGGSGMVVDEGRATPETSTPGHTRAGSTRSDAQSQGYPPMIDPQLTDTINLPEFPEPSFRPQTPGEPEVSQHALAVGHSEAPSIPTPSQPYQQQAQTAQMRPQQSTPQPFVPQSGPSVRQQPYNPVQQSSTIAPLTSPSTSASTSYTPSAVPAGSPFFTANSIAKRNGNPEVQQPLAYLFSVLQHDKELEHLLQAAVHNQSKGDQVNDRKSDLGRKIRRVKNNYRAQATSPLYRTPFTSVGAETSRQAPSATGSPSVSHQSTIAQTSPQNSLHPKHLRSTSTSLPQRLSSARMDPGSAHPASGEDAATGQPLLSSRRASSSSLSSTNSNKIEGLEPPAASQPSLKRSADEAGSLLDAHDEEMEAQRKRLRRDFSNVDVSQSSMRKPPPNSATALSGQPASPQKPGKALRYWPPGVRTEVTEASDAMNGDGPATPTALGRPPSTKKKVTPRTKMSPMKSTRKAAVAGQSRPETRGRRSLGDDDKSEDSDNNDYCTACGGPGYLLCCDGCDRSFHFTCLDPPYDEDRQFEKQWYCSECEAQRDTLDRPPPGLFADLEYNLVKVNTKAFELPRFIRDQYRGVKTGEGGEYLAVVEQRPIKGGRIGYDNEHAPDYKKLRDAKGNAILCFACGKSALGGRDIIPCDYCALNWHLDCLNPPLANPPYRGNFANLDIKTRPAWMCPTHAYHEIKTLDASRGGLAGQPDAAEMAKVHRLRIPIHPKIVPVHMRRGFANNGMIEVETESDDSGFESDESNGIIYKLPRRGIMLDFLDKVKSNRLAVERNTRESAATLHLHAEQLRLANERRLSLDISQRQMAERKAAFNLAQFKQSNQDLKLGNNELENLLYTLEAEAPEDVMSLLNSKRPRKAPSPSFDYDTRHKKQRRAVSKGLPSPSPSRSVSEVKTTADRQREILQRLQTHIQQKLETLDTPDAVNGVA